GRIEFDARRERRTVEDRRMQDLNGRRNSLLRAARLDFATNAISHRTQAYARCRTIAIEHVECNLSVEDRLAYSLKRKQQPLLRLEPLDPGASCFRYRLESYERQALKAHAL